MNDSHQNRTIALCGAFQSIQLINQFAFIGRAEPDCFQTNLKSLLQKDPKKTIDVYGNKDAIKEGAKELLRSFEKESNPQETIIINRYLFSLLHLEKKLRNDSEKLSQIKRRLDFIESQINYFSIDHPNVIQSLADLYLDTIGQYKFRIKIVGKPDYLKQTDIMQKIRVLLFSGVRALILWRQLGGRKFHFLLHRKKIINIAKEIIAE